MTAHPALIALELAADTERWRREVRYHADGPVVRPIGTNAWLMSWLPGQRTDWHAHDGWVGGFTVVAGTITERVRRAAGEALRHRLEPGQARVFGPSYRHQLVNDGLHPAVVIMCVTAAPAWLPGFDEPAAA